DGTQEQVVAAFGAAEFHVVRGAVTSGEVDQAQLRVVDDGIPGVAATAHRPPLAGPGLGSHFHRGVGGFAVRHAGFAGHDEEAPGLFTRFRVVGADVAARTHVAAAVADHHQAAGHAR